MKTRIIHPQHNGRRKTKQGDYIAAHYIREIRAFYGDEPVLTMQTSAALSQNPLLVFPLKVTRSAPFRVVWIDTQDREYSATVHIRA